MLTGVEKLTCCQPDVLSPVKVAEARGVPPAVHRLPTCVPVFVVTFQKRIPLIVPATSEVNLTPTVMALVSPESLVTGVAFPHIEQGHETFTVMPLEGVSTFPPSSIARVMILAVGTRFGTQLYDQELVPVAGCQVEPPSVETSTPATTPPPLSFAVPEIVILVPSARDALSVGDAMVEVGAVVSVDCVPATSPDISAYGWAPMSAKRFTVACCMLRSGPLLVGPFCPHALVLSSPHDHCTVPAPKTKAPLGARYRVRLCVSGNLVVVLLP